MSSEFVSTWCVPHTERCLKSDGWCNEYFYRSFRVRRPFTDKWERILLPSCRVYFGNSSMSDMVAEYASTVFGRTVANDKSELMTNLGLGGHQSPNYFIGFRVDSPAYPNLESAFDGYGNWKYNFWLQEAAVFYKKHCVQLPRCPQCNKPPGQWRRTHEGSSFISRGPHVGVRMNEYSWWRFFCSEACRERDFAAYKRAKAKERARERGLRKVREMKTQLKITRKLIRDLTTGKEGVTTNG